MSGNVLDAGSSRYGLRVPLPPESSLVTPRRLLVVLSALAALAASLAFVDGAQGAAERRPDPVRTMPDIRAVNARGDVSAGRIKGFDGLDYESAPFAVEGLDGELFLGPDFDVACGLGQGFERAMKTYAKVARLIEKSGRTVVFTAAPNKSAVMPERLDPATLPHGACDTEGLAAQSRIIDNFEDPNYLPLRQKLIRNPHQTYWKTDPHWTTVGASVFVKALADRLDPKLGRRQHYTYGTEVGLGMLNAQRGDSTTETLETAFPDTAVKVRSGRGCDEWAGYPTLIYDTCWNSSTREEDLAGADPAAR